MLTCLLNNLQLMGILIAMYVGAFGANTLLGIYSNLAQAKEQFSKEKLIILFFFNNDMCKYSSVQEGDCDSRRGAQKLGISVEEGMLEGISMVAIAGVMVSTILRYLKDAMSKFYGILYKEKEDKIEG